MTYTARELEEYTRNTVTKERDILESNAELISYYLDNCQITVPTESRFFVRLNCAWVMDTAKRIRSERTVKAAKELPLYKGEECRAYSGFYDFGHTCPDWDSIISLGIHGLYERVKKYRESNTDCERKPFLDAAYKAYGGAMRLIQRAEAEARTAGKTEMANGLLHLSQGAPSTLFEAMQTTLIYYTVQQMAECTILRTLGRLDGLYLDFYKKEEDKGHAMELIRDFLLETDRLRVGSNLPFAIGATPSGESHTELTLPFLKAYRAAELKDTKLHLLYRRDIPEEILREAFSAIREGNNSILFMSDEKITESLIKLGEDPDDAKNYHVVGCYECGGRGEVTCSCAARINLVKAVEYAMSGGVDLLSGNTVGLQNDGVFRDFDSFFREVVRQAHHLCACAMELTEHYEKDYKRIFAAPVFSSSYEFALKSGKDFYYANGAKYNNSSLNALGLATATDSLSAIRKLVFEDEELTLAQLTKMLRTNFRDNEVLRLRIKNRFPKYGVGDPNTDSLARGLVDAVAEFTNGRPNARGGVWRLGTFSIDWRWDFGAHTAASADGRLSGEPISQNSGASFCQDKEGATAHMLSVAAIDSSLTPNGTVLDLDLHSSSVSGDNGLRALIDGLCGYFELGGFSVHYNVLSSEVLRKAKAHPENYPNLQVRLCGWNVLFSSLTDKEKDEFIRRAEVKER